MALAMLLALWLGRECAFPCIFVLAYTHNAYKDWEAGERAWNPGISLGLLTVP